MIDPELYEVCIAVAGDEHYYRVEHGFAQLPETETLVALKQEAADTFDALFPSIPIDDFDIYVRRLTPDERSVPEDREHSEKP